MANAHEGRITKVRIACVAGAAIIAVGIWANWPYLAVEHQRLESWKIAGLLIGDVMGLLWFSRFAFSHAVSGDPLVPVPVSNGRRNLRLITFAGLVAILIDLGFTLFLMRDERDGYARGKVAEAQVIAIQEHRRPDATGYELDCRFKDEAGQPHEAHLRVLAEHHVLPSALPPAAVRVLSGRGEEQGSIPIRYDAQFPARAWIDGLGWDDENGIYWFSLGTSALQGGVIAVFLLSLGRHSGGGMWPWWWDTYKVLPLVAETFCLLMMGLIDRMMDMLA
jgi:hypothetical protein